MNNHSRNGKSAKKHNGVSSTSIDDLPSEILFHIFFRLQITSVMICKAVCRNWRTVIHGGDFINKYGVNAPFFYLVNKVNTLSPYRFSFMGISQNGDSVEMSVGPKMPYGDISGSSLSIVDSCNGVLCFEVANAESIFIYVANPVTGQCIVLPGYNNLWPRGCLHHSGCMSGACHRFGFSRLTNTLKVVRNVYIKNDLYMLNRFDIFTVGVDTAWRSLYHLSARWIMDDSVFLRGSFHWIAMNNEGYLTIHSFELDEERNGEISHPRGIELQSKRHRLASLGGSLCLLNETISRITVWKMAEYGVTDSWTRIVIVRFMYHPDVLNWDLSVVSLSENGEYLLINKVENSLVSYNCETMKYTKIADFEFSNPFIFTPTLKRFIGYDDRSA